MLHYAILKTSYLDLIKNANDVRVISTERHKLDLSVECTYGTINAMFVKIQPVLRT